MKFYLLLAVSTASLAILAILTWRKTRQLAYPIGLFFVYFWTLHGAWSIVSDGLNNRVSGYQYLFEKLFPIYLDGYYFQALVLYSLFCIVLAATVCTSAPRHLPRPEHPLRPVEISHPVIICITAFAGVVSYLIVRDSFDVAIAYNQSAYAITRVGGAIEYFTIHQVLNRVALLPAAIGLAVVLSGEDAKYLTGKSGRSFLPGYLMVILLMYVFCAALGNKNELFAASLAGGLFYFANSRRPRYGAAIAMGLGALALIATVDGVRGLPINDAREVFTADALLNAVPQIWNSNEAFGAHFSMYGALRYEIPLTYGWSIASLLLSVVPRIVWPDRPPDIYPYYAESVGAVSGQGYSMHHATGWYLNFGLPGVVAGAVFLGWIWTQLHLRALSSTNRSAATRLFLAVAPWTIVAGIPNLIRAGIEGYKGLVVDSFLVPWAVLFLAHFVVVVSRAGIRDLRPTYRRNAAAPDMETMRTASSLSRSHTGRVLPPTRMSNGTRRTEPSLSIRRARAFGKDH